MVTKVKHALTLSEPPSVEFTPNPPGPVKLPPGAAQQNVVEQFNNSQEDNVEEVEDITPEEDGQSQVEPPGTNPGGDTPDKMAKTKSQFVKKQPDPGITSAMTLIPVTATIAMTPIMLSARQYCITKLSWRKDMPWENLFDTWITLLFRDHGVILHGWFEVDENNNPVDESLPEEEPTNGNGVSPEIVEFAKAFANEFAKPLKELASAIKGGQHAS